MPKHVVIIGAGVIGLCSAWYCRQRGLRVTVIDRNPAERDGCSFGNAGFIVPSHFVPLAAPGMVSLGLRMMGNPESPFYVKPRLSWDLLSWGWRFWRASTRARVERAAPVLRDLHLASRGLYAELADAWNNDFGLVTKGLLALCATQHTLDEEARAAEMGRRLDIAAEILDRAGIVKLEPNVRVDACGAIYFPGDAHLNPPLFMAALQRHLEESGCEFGWSYDATEFDVRNRRIHSVQTSRGPVEGDEFVLAGGSWSPALARSIGLKLPMQPGKGYSLTLPRPRQLPALPALCVEARLAVTPMGSSLRFGGTMEMSGLNRSINPARVRGIINSAVRFYPDFRPEDFESVAPWTGLRPCSPDGLPYLGRTARCDNVTIAAGHAMLGLSMGPITGKLVSQLVSNEPPSIDLTLLSPDRY